MLRLLFVTIVLFVAGCQSKVVQEFPLTKFKAEAALDRGIREYDDGDYRVAARTIQGALDAGLTTRSQGRAHKYLAFIHCIAGDQPACRDQFRKAFEADPKLELKPEESGHPIWDPVYRNVRVEMAKK